MNRVNSKATLRIPLSALLPLLPSILRSAITSSRYCAAKSDALVIQADDSRKQNDNVQSCLVKLHNLIVEVGQDAVPGETSVEQTERVKRLYVEIAVWRCRCWLTLWSRQKSENEGRLRIKKRQSEKKSARRGGGKADY